MKELQALYGRLDFAHIDERQLVFWSRISRTKNVVLRTCYGILGMLREFSFSRLIMT